MMKQPPAQLISAFLAWFGSDVHSGQEDAYREKVNQGFLAGLSHDGLVAFFYGFARDGGFVQSGGARTAPLLRETMNEHYDAFRRYVLEPFASGFDDVEWLSRLGEYRGFGQGIATIYLNRVDKHRYAILNNKSVAAMQLLGVSIPTVLPERYRAVRDAERALITLVSALCSSNMAIVCRDCNDCLRQ